MLIIVNSIHVKFALMMIILNAFNVIQDISLTQHLKLAKILVLQAIMQTNSTVSVKSV